MARTAIRHRAIDIRSNALTTDALEIIAPGSIGIFWRLVDGKPALPQIHGAVRRDDEGYWVVDLEGSDLALAGEDGDRDATKSLVGVLSTSTIFLSDRNRWRETRPWSATGQRLHVVHIWFETVITGFDVSSLDSEGIVAAESVFPKQMNWAAYGIPDFRWRDKSEPLGEGWTLDIPNFPETTLRVSNDLTLKVKATWRADSGEDRIHVPFGLSLMLISREPRPTRDFVEALESFQDLISLCWGSRVPCAPGSGQVNQKHASGRFWSQRLIGQQPTGSAALKGRPAIRLDDLGGPQAFIRWLDLCHSSARATRGVREGLYVGASAEVRLLNAVSAIEYWVGKNRRKAEWASQVGGKNKARILVMYQIPIFKQWVGDGERFSARLWWDYNALKHDPTHVVDYEVISVFGLTARLMLIGSLLDQVAGTTVPSQRIAEHFWQLREATNDLLQEPARCDVPEDPYRRNHKRQGPRAES